jgi:exonuclease III
MASIPSKYRSEKIQELAGRFGITDPFRFKNPTSRDFTYIPNVNINRNRSRIDFFLISESMCRWVLKCEIEPALRSVVFDHKAVNLVMGNVSKKVNKKSNTKKSDYKISYAGRRI